MLTRYLDDREAVLGRRWWVADDERAAAARLVDQLGRREARRWLARVLRELEEVTQ